MLLGSPNTRQIWCKWRGNASLTLFQNYWGDDLSLISGHEVLQKQLNGIQTLCANILRSSINQKGRSWFSANTIKSKSISITEQVTLYKHLGNIITSVSTAQGDIFRDNNVYLLSQAKTYFLTMKNKLRHLGSLPPRLMFHLFESLVRPMLLYGSDVWGHSYISSETSD